MLVRVSPSLCRDYPGRSLVIRVGAVLIACCCVRVAAVSIRAYMGLGLMLKTPKEHGSSRILIRRDPALSGTAVSIRAYMGLGLMFLRSRNSIEHVNYHNIHLSGELLFKSS